MDKFKIDSHKLIYHIGRVNDWLAGKDIYPIYLEIATSGACNQRCTYCALDFMEYQPRCLDTVLLKERLSQMALLGVKSIMYAGEGEPLLHKDIKEIINHTKRNGIDVALTTNGVLLNKDFINDTLNNITWIKVSINGARARTYTRIHRGSPYDFKRVMANLSYAVRLKRIKGYKCTLGMQLILLPENCKEVISLAEKAKDMGIDYLVIKPYSQHPFSKTVRYKNIKYKKYLNSLDRLRLLNTDNFNVVLRINTMKKWDERNRCYKHCYALPFWAYIDAGGDVWGCSGYLGDRRFVYGNIYKKSFQEIWKSKNRLNLVNWAKDELNTDKCRVNCRMDEVNRYLWELKNPPEHVNFI